MKVFTVGLDQKPPIKDASDPSAEKTAGGSPPPGYAANTTIKHIPLPMGPEIPQPPHPIVVRKSRGYKGILMVMLAVFLMALFALTLSEIAYNRQRDENFFRLRWAELKHRLGYGENGFDYYHRANAAMNTDRFFSLGRTKELSEALVQQSEPTSTTTTPSLSSTSEPVVAIDSFPPKPSTFEQPQDGPSGMIRDARLQFLKTILQKIKQHAEDMGFDGTMQVSVIEVEPQVDEPFSPFGSQHQQPHQMGKGQPSQSFHPLLPNFFPHIPIEDQQGPKSDSFLDGFGEFHQPTFMQNNQVVEQNRARANGPFGGSPWPHDDDSQQHPHNADFVDVGSIHWPRANANPFRPDSLFHPGNNWQVLPPQQQQQQQPQGQQGFPQAPHILPRPPSFDRWSGVAPQNNMLDSDDSSQQQPHGPQQPPMIQIFPQQPQMPMLPPMLGPHVGQQEHSQQQEKSTERFGPDSSNGSPSQEIVGEIYGRKFGRMLQDIIANRIQGFQNMHQMNFIPPEDRIQVEPPQTFPNQQQQLPLGDGPMGPAQPPQRGPSSSTSSNSDEPLVKTVVDHNMSGPRGWTHQFPKSSQQHQSVNSDSQENVAPVQTPMSSSPEQEGPSPLGAAPHGGMESGKSNSASTEQQHHPQQPPNSASNENEDVWLVAPPPHRTQPPRRPMLHSSTSADTSSATPVDFPAVKFPSNNNANPTINAAPKPAVAPSNAEAGDAVSGPQNDHGQSVHSNPVFFQVDDPSSIEQQPPRVVV